VPIALRDWGRRALPALPPLDRRTRWLLLAVVAVGAVLRIAWALRAESPVELRDPVLYLILGDNLAHGNGYSYGPGIDQGTTAYYPPGYPLLLGAVTWLVRLVLPGAVDIFPVAIALNVVLSVATIPLVFVLGRRLVGRRVGLAAAAVWALWPNLVFHAGIVLTETLFLFLFVLMLIVALGDPGAARSPGRARVVTVGVLLGLCILVRPVSIVTAPVFLVLWWGNGLRAAAWRLALVGAVAVAVLVPWSVRSTLAMDAPVALSLNLGDNLCIGHNPSARGGYGSLQPHCFNDTGLRRPESETRRQSENIRRALRYVRDHPGTTLARTPNKVWITVDRDDDGLDVAEDFGSRPIMSDAARSALTAAANGWYLLVVAGAAVGAVLLVRRPDPARRGLFLVAVGLAQLVPPLLTFGDPRFKMPVYPTLAVCAAVAAVAGWDRLRGRGPAGAGDAAESGALGEDRRVAAGAAAP
jgi:hypothetical protein